MRTTHETLVLPDQYSMVQGVFGGSEVVNLRDRAKWGTDRNIHLWDDVIARSIVSTGVIYTTDEQQLLVGVGFLAGNRRNAILCDMVVDPDHRRRGLGKAILLDRVRRAVDMGIPYLYTELSSTNTLKDVYLELGFQELDNGYTRAARRHPDE